MLGVLCAKSPPKPWILSPRTFSLLHLHHHYHHIAAADDDPRRIHPPSDGGASIWRGGVDWRRDYLRRPPIQNGEGSWNVAWDARPARWLNRLDFVCLLLWFYLKEAVNSETTNLEAVNSEAVNSEAVNLEVVKNDDGEMNCGEVGDVGNGRNCDDDGGGDLEVNNCSNYRVTGVLADGRCLFRAIAHGACLQSGEEAPDEIRQRELADDLRARVVDEFLKRREEIEWSIEEDFDTYVKKIQEPYVWGGEPELLMASHYLRTPISVFMKDKSTGNLKTVANYGKSIKRRKSCPSMCCFMDMATMRFWRLHPTTTSDSHKKRRGRLWILSLSKA